jgi:ABC-type spermidine/putrescine transport system permease subunit I
VPSFAGGNPRRQTDHSLTNFLLLLPALLLLGLFFYFPLARLVAVSFGYPKTLSFTNYISFAVEPVYLTVLFNTLRLSLIVTVVCLLLSYPVAYLMSTLRGPMLGVVITIVLMPFWTSLLARTFAWMVLLGRNGVINWALVSLGLISEPLELIHNTFGAVVGSVQILLPFMILPIYASMRKVDGSLTSAAMSLGASPLSAFLRVFFPLTVPGVLGGSLTVFILTTGFYIVPALMGGPRDSVIAPFIYMTATTLLDAPMAATMAVVLLAAVLLIYVPVWRSLRLDTLFRRG